jgi:hypothetical protein
MANRLTDKTVALPANGGEKGMITNSAAVPFSPPFAVQTGYIADTCSETW